MGPVQVQLSRWSFRYCIFIFAAVPAPANYWVIYCSRRAKFCSLNLLFFLDNGSLTFTFPVLGRADTGGRRRELRPALSVSIYMLLPAFPSISHLLNVQAGRLPGDQLHCGGFCCLPVNEAWQLLHQVSPLADGEDFGIFWY